LAGTGSARDLDPTQLSATQAKAEAARLGVELTEHSHRYFALSAPTVSDEEYDALFRRLQEIEERFPELQFDDSPTQRIGAPPVDELPTLDHAAPMLSLDSSQKLEDVERFDERLRKALGNDVSYILEPKLDGASLELVYEEGELVRAVTRGNGRSGEGVTENVRTIGTVPLRLRTDKRPAPEFLSVRGEVLMYLSAFEALNARMLARGSDAYINPRNTASGALRQLDSRNAADRPLELLAYDILKVRGVEFRTDFEGTKALADWGFKLPERIELAESVEQIAAYHKRFGADRGTLDYEIDGVVIKLNDIAEREDLGATSHHPRWAMALKFEPQKQTTRIQGIEVSVGRTGKVTPVAILEPVSVGGVTVSRATLHNRKELARKDVRAGDLVRVQRAGDVIPQVVGRVKEKGRKRGEEFTMPDRCPSCDAELEERGPFTVCPNRFGCVAQLTRGIEHFASRGALDIEGLGEETSTLLVDRGLVNQLAELFDLDAATLSELPGFAAKSAQNLEDAIQARKHVELERFLHGLGIPEVGATVALALARHFQGIEQIREASAEQFEEVKGVGPKMSLGISEFLTDPRNASAIDAILAKGFSFVLPEPLPKGGALDGKTFVFTGGLGDMSRGEAKAAVEAAGGSVKASVSAKTDYVVSGEDPGSKLRKAQDLGLPILDPEEFRALIEEAQK